MAVGSLSVIGIIIASQPASNLISCNAGEPPLPWFGFPFRLRLSRSATTSQQPDSSPTSRLGEIDLRWSCSGSAQQWKGREMASATAAFVGAAGGVAAAAGGVSWGVRTQTQQQNKSFSRKQQQQQEQRAASLRWGACSSISSSSALLRPQRALQGCASRTLTTTVVAAGDIERSYIMIKPDGVQRGLVGEIISRFERKGFTLKGLKLFQTPQELAETHYGELKEKPFFPKLVKYIVSGPVVAMVWEGPGVVASARKLIGVTNPLNAEPGTIRGDFGVNTGRNVIHGSDSPENGEREIGLWFKEGEVVDWEPSLTPWILE